MQRLIRSTDIRSKTFLAFGLLLMLSLILAFGSLWELRAISRYHHMAQAAGCIQTIIQQVRKNEKAFLLSEVKEDVFYKSKESQHHRNIKAGIEAIQQQLQQSGLAAYSPTASMVANLQADIQNYARTFDQLVVTVWERGHKDYGKIGKLRKAIHRLEQMPYDYDKVKMLMLRRHEKDFLLRRDLRYEKRFTESFDSFRSEVAGTLTAQLLPSDSLALVLSWLDQYHDNFLEVTQIERQIGLNPNQGIMATLEQAATATETATDQMQAFIQDESDRKQVLAYATLGIVLVLQLVVGVILASQFSRRLAQRIRALQKHIQQLSLGKTPKALSIQGQDELDIAGTALNQLSEGVQRYVQFAQSIGQGNFDSTFEKLSDEDQLGAALLNMQADLRTLREQETRRRFVLDKVAEFSALIRQQPEDLLDRALQLLVKSTDATLGGLFVSSINEQNQIILKLEACYAWKRKKYISQTITPGEGLAGQIFLEQERVLLTEIPPDYLQIKSGLGTSTPKCLLITPVKTDGRVVGVIEIASFSVFQEHQLALVERVSEALAIAILSQQHQQETKQLMETSRRQAEALAKQEATIHQNNEELWATREEMARKEKEYLQKIARLKVSVV